MMHSRINRLSSQVVKYDNTENVLNWLAQFVHEREGVLAGRRPIPGNITAVVGEVGPNNGLSTFASHIPKIGTSRSNRHRGLKSDRRPCLSDQRLQIVCRDCEIQVLAFAICGY